MEEVVQEMTLDEWKNLQEQNRPKREFNIRKPETSVPSKAVVIHKSKYRDDDVSIQCSPYQPNAKMYGFVIESCTKEYSEIDRKAHFSLSVSRFYFGIEQPVCCFSSEI